MMFAFVEKGIGNYLEVSGDRMRAAWWRLRGARLGRKARIGPNSAIMRPWCLQAGERVQLERGVYIKIASDAARVVLGEQVFLGFGAELDVSGDLRMGDHVLVAPGCFITDHHHRRAPHEQIAAQGCQSEPVIIEDDVWLGANSVILAGVRIGKGAIVGAGAVVTRDVESMAIVAGVPASVIGKRD